MPWTHLTPVLSNKALVWGSVLNLGAITGFGRCGAVVLVWHILDVAPHKITACALRVVPCKVNTGAFLAFPVFNDGAVLFKDGSEVQSMAFANIFNAEDVNNEGELDRAPLVSP